MNNMDIQESDDSMDNTVESLSTMTESQLSITPDINEKDSFIPFESSFATGSRPNENIQNYNNKTCDYNEVNGGLIINLNPCNRMEVYYFITILENIDTRAKENEEMHNDDRHKQTPLKVAILKIPETILDYYLKKIIQYGYVFSKRTEGEINYYQYYKLFCKKEEEYNFIPSDIEEDVRIVLHSRDKKRVVMGVLQTYVHLPVYEKRCGFLWMESLKNFIKDTIGIELDSTVESKLIGSVHMRNICDEEKTSISDCVSFVVNDTQQLKENYKWMEIPYVGFDFNHMKRMTMINSFLWNTKELFWMRKAANDMEKTLNIKEIIDDNIQMITYD